MAVAARSRTNTRQPVAAESAGGLREIGGGYLQRFSMLDSNSRIRRPVKRRTVAILGYHKIGEPAPGGWETWFYIPETTFIEHLTYLHEHGWPVLDLATFLKGLDDPDLLPERTALLTFDDGYRSMRHVTLPCLQRFGDPAVLFVPTDFVGGTNAFDNGAEPDEPICDWDDLRVLARAGVSIQSHSVTHRAFSELSPVEQEQELCRSKAVLEAELGEVVEVFSFPFGDSGTDTEFVPHTLQRAGYRAACLYGGGLNPWPVADRYRLNRVAMGPDTDLQAELEKTLESV